MIAVAAITASGDLMLRPFCRPSRRMFPGLGENGLIDVEHLKCRTLEQIFESSADGGIVKVWKYFGHDLRTRDNYRLTTIRCVNDLQKSFGFSLGSFLTGQQGDEDAGIPAVLRPRHRAAAARTSQNRGHPSAVARLQIGFSGSAAHRLAG